MVRGLGPVARAGVALGAAAGFSGAAGTGFGGATRTVFLGAERPGLTAAARAFRARAREGATPEAADPRARDPVFAALRTVAGEGFDATFFTSSSADEAPRPGVQSEGAPVGESRLEPNNGARPVERPYGALPALSHVRRDRGPWTNWRGGKTPSVN